MSRRILGPLPEHREGMRETYAQMEYAARLYAKLGFKYIIGWRDVRGYGIAATKCCEWIPAGAPAYINLRLS